MSDVRIRCSMFDVLTRMSEVRNQIDFITFLNKKSRFMSCCGFFIKFCFSQIKYIFICNYRLEKEVSVSLEVQIINCFIKCFYAHQLYRLSCKNKSILLKKINK